MITTAVALALLLSVGAPADPEPAGKDPLSKLSWMAGRWSGEDAGTSIEEVWLEPRGGLMLALHRDVKGGRAVSFEFLRIESTREGIVYFASPQGAPATPFRFVEASSGSKRAVFENPTHDFPNRILYWLDGAGAMHARIEGKLEGKAESQEWVWRKGD